MRIGLQTIHGEANYVINEWRFLHTHILGKPGMGKSTLMKRAAIDDIQKGEGVVFFDFTGDDAYDLMRHIPPERWDDTILFDPADRKFPIGWNILHEVPEEEQPRMVNAVLDAFHSLYPSNIATTNVDQYIQATTAALLHCRDETLMGIYFMLFRPQYREYVLSHSKDMFVEDFWLKFYDSIPDKEKRQVTQSTLSRVFNLLIDPTVRNIIGQPRNKLNLKDVMDKGQILIVLLPIGQLGDERSKFLATFMLSQLYAAALDRPKARKPFHLYLSDVHRFGSGLVVSALDRMGDRDVSLTLSHRYLSQLSDELRDALFGSVGTTVAFQLGPLDAATLERQFPPNNSRTALTDLQPFTAVAKAPGGMFDALEMPRIAAPIHADAPRAIRTLTRRHYATQRRMVEERIKCVIADA